MKKSIVLALALCALPGIAMAQEPTGTLKRIADSKTITLGVRESSVPFSYVDDSGKAVGYAMDICNHVADVVKDELGLDTIEIRHVAVTSSTRIPLMANGTIDLECGSTTNNLERQQQVGFTNTHYLTASAYVSKKEKGLNTIDDLRGKSVVSTAGTTNIKQLTALNQERGLGINIQPVKDHAAGFLMVETDRADAFVMDDVLLASLIASSREPALYAISQEALSKPEPYGIMVPKGDDAFKAVVDKATAEFYQSPEGTATYEKWFLSPIPPRQLNLNVPMSAALTKAFANPTDSADPASY